jgi:hypothetical protein
MGRRRVQRPAPPVRRRLLWGLGVALCLGACGPPAERSCAVCSPLFAAPGSQTGDRCDTRVPVGHPAKEVLAALECCQENGLVCDLDAPTFDTPGPDIRGIEGEYVTATLDAVDDAPPGVRATLLVLPYVGDTVLSCPDITSRFGLPAAECERLRSTTAEPRRAPTACSTWSGPVEGISAWLEGELRSISVTSLSSVSASDGRVLEQVLGQARAFTRDAVLSKAFPALPLACEVPLAEAWRQTVIAEAVWKVRERADCGADAALFSITGEGTTTLERGELPPVVSRRTVNTTCTMCPPSPGLSAHHVVFATTTDGKPWIWQSPTIGAGGVPDRALADCLSDLLEPTDDLSATGLQGDFTVRVVRVE